MGDEVDREADARPGRPGPHGVGARHRAVLGREGLPQRGQVVRRLDVERRVDEDQLDVGVGAPVVGERPERLPGEEHPDQVRSQPLGGLDGQDVLSGGLPAALGHASLLLPTRSALGGVMWWRPIGSIRGFPDVGSTITWQSRPNTARTFASVSTSAGVPTACTRPDGQRDEVVGVAGGEVEVVQDHDDRRPAGAVEVGQQVEDLDLVGSRRGTSSARRAAAGRSAGRAPWRSTPAGAARRRARRRGGRPASSSGWPRAPRRPRRRPPGSTGRRALVRVAAAADEVGDGDALRCDRRLGQQAERAGQLLGRHAVHRPAVEQDLPARGAPAAGTSTAAGSTCRRRWHPRWR